MGYVTKKILSPSAYRSDKEVGLKHVFWRERERNNRIIKKRTRRLRKKRREMEYSKRRRLRKICGGSYCPPLKIVAPEKICIGTDEMRGRVIEFLAELRRPFIAGKTGTVLIDMHGTTRFVVDGTLLFYAELHRLLDIGRGNLRIRIKPPKNQKADQVLCQIGAYKLCGMDRACKSNFNDVVHWRVARGYVVDNSLCAPAIEAFEGQLAPPLLDGIFRGLGEAMTNTRHHAYMDTRGDGLNYKQPESDWWMFSQARDGMLSVVFCDLGVGIPNTLPIKKKSLFEKIVSLGLSESDSAYIEQAIEDTRTRTHLPGRGHGLGNIVDTVSRYEKGMVLIFSNRGSYTLKHGKVVTHDFKENIMGTLIYWHVPLQGA